LPSIPTNLIKSIKPFNEISRPQIKAEKLGKFKDFKLNYKYDISEQAS
jgi:hypothetical protein